MLGKPGLLLRCACLLLIASGCSQNFLPNSDVIEGGRAAYSASAPDVVITSGSRDISILTYNVAGLPWPLRKDRKAALYAIGDDLSLMHEQGRAPDIVLIQEGFSQHMAEMIRRSGYSYYAKGPSRRDRADESQSIVPSGFLQSGQFAKGEKAGKILNSGLYVLSKWPIRTQLREPFFKGACAGFDCAANKGLLWVEIDVPGMPGYLQVMTTHLNSHRSSGVSQDRSLQAHNLQIVQIAKFIERHLMPEQPLIFGGDFNIMDAGGQFDNMATYHEKRAGAEGHKKGLSLFICADDPGCEMRVTPPTKELPLISQNWQGFSFGEEVKIKPLRVEPLFHRPDPRGLSIRGRPTLSDHDGRLVTYRLSW